MNELEFNDEDELAEPLKTEARRELALEMSALMNEPIDFDIGDFVVWKSRSLRNKGYPLLDEPVLVVKINESHVRHPTDDADAPEFREPLSLVFGRVDEDKELPAEVTQMIEQGKQLITQLQQKNKELKEENEDKDEDR